MRRSHFTAVACPTGRVVRLCERDSNFGDPDEWIAIAWPALGSPCQADKIVQVTTDDGLDYVWAFGSALAGLLD